LRGDTTINDASPGKKLGDLFKTCKVEYSVSLLIGEEKPKITLEERKEKRAYKQKLYFSFILSRPWEKNNNKQVGTTTPNLWAHRD